MSDYDPLDDFEAFTVTEYDTNRPRYFAKEEWALAFARGERAYAEQKCGILVEVGADDEATEAAELLEGGFIPAEEWVGLTSVGGEAYGNLVAAGERGAYWRDI